ncbi:hypothetical protein K440DRAFT_612862 [Wilcoxina mikolae CBS 423.85]|nr:hypothetical protein K440DRAFT_612862 [Wilcoxina mikolae CBS 423.85]
MASARVLPPTTGGGLFPYTGSTERSPSSGTDRLRDLRACTRAYEPGFVSSLHVRVCSPGGLQIKRGMM